MLRNGFKRAALGCKHQRNLSISYTTSYNKNNFNMKRQGKIMSKLFGQKVSGSKKRWYPTTEPNALNKSSASLFFKDAQLRKPGSAGKNTSRRSAVLNKLFMEEISSLLATGDIAACFLGRGLQLTRVKISPDFAVINVYWLASGDPLKDEKLADDLKRYSGLIRHELSQLRLMGEVPRIHFLQDKTFANIENVEALLKNMDLKNEENESEDENKIDFQNYTAKRIKEEFYGNNKNNLTTALETTSSLPSMRHDVFGLDHKNIMDKILTKMKKTKQAWEAHNERATSDKQSEFPILASVQQKVKDMSEISSSEFGKFLSQRTIRKMTPERKKYRPDNITFNTLTNTTEEFESDAVVSKELKNYLYEEDYLHEDHFDDKKA